MYGTGRKEGTGGRKACERGPGGRRKGTGEEGKMEMEGRDGTEVGGLECRGSDRPEEPTLATQPIPP